MQGAGGERRKEQGGKLLFLEHHTTIGLLQSLFPSWTTWLWTIPSLSNLKWYGLYGQGCGVRYMGFGSFPTQPHTSCGTSGKTGKSNCTAIS